LKEIGPRYQALHGPWKGTYSSKKITWFMPTYTWERDHRVSNGVKGCLTVIPETWVSDDFRYVAVPPTATFYFIDSEPKTESFNDFITPDPGSWAEYDAASFARRNGCKVSLCLFSEGITMNKF
jgi:hypothetical protein